MARHTEQQINDSIREFLLAKRNAARLKKLAPDLLAVLRFIEPALSAKCDDDDDLRQAARMVREVVGKADAAGI